MGALPRMLSATRHDFAEFLVADRHAENFFVDFLKKIPWFFEHIPGRAASDAVGVSGTTAAPTDTPSG